jgi:predicted PurR-regulated permease PerM
MQRPYSLQNRVFFYTILAVLSGLGLWLSSSYLGIIVFSLVMVIILKPVYTWFERLLRGRAGLATAATLIALLLAIIIPSWFMVNVVSNQVDTFIESLGLAEDSVPLTLEEFQTRVNNLTNDVPLIQELELTDEQVANLKETLLGAATWVAKTMVGLGMSIPALIARLFIFLAIVGMLLPNYHRFVLYLINLSPLDDEVDRLFLRKIKAMVWSMFVGIAVIAVIQGLITGLFIWLGNVPYAPLWTLLAIVASTLPLGASIVAIPIAIIELIMGNPVGALIILGGYLLVVTNIDNIIRPKLVSKEAYLSPALVLVGALGGYTLFGFFGVIYGPVLMVLLTTAIEVYDDYYAERDQSVSPTSAGITQIDPPVIGEPAADATQSDSGSTD